MPWWTFEVPLTGEVSDVHPWIYVGGRAFTFVYFALMLTGSAMFVCGRRSGILIVAIPAATIAWFALAISILGSIFHNILGFFGSFAGVAMLVDTGDPGAWIRQGQGLIIAIVCGIAVGVVAVLQFEPLCRVTWLKKDLYSSLLTAAVLVALLASSKNSWVVANVVGQNIRIRIQGDQIFGSAIIDGLLWVTLGLWTLSVLSSSKNLRKSVQVVTAIVAFLRLVQCGLVLASASLFESVIPDSISIGHHVDRLSSLYMTIGLSLVVVPLSFSSALSHRIRMIFWGLICALLGFGLVVLAVSN
jgi:hypothetical protein